MRETSRVLLTRGTAVLGAGALALLAAGPAPHPAQSSAPPPPAHPSVVQLQLSDAGIADLPQDLTFKLSPQLAAMLGRTTLNSAGLAKLQAAARPGMGGESTPAVGTTLLWPALDIDRGGPIGLYLKPYTLRAVGEKIEVWVASGQDLTSAGTAFPAGDCRNAVPHSTDITDSQVAYLVGQFDTNIYPKETKAFSIPPDRTGTNTVPGLAGAGLDFAGDGAHTVTLIDNVRDPNFYDFANNQSYVAGFYAPIFNQLTDRNVMTVDAFDWLHRTGAHPSNQPDADICKSRPARPFTYESVFGHEWQHLLHQYQDEKETTWVNEGLSMFAESLDGYTDTRLSVRQPGGQADIYCFQGFGTVKTAANPNPRNCGGPQNSLTSWGDEGAGSEILADYGNAWSFMLFLFDRYGLPFMGALHRDGTHQGLASVQAQLDMFAPGTKVQDVLHDFQLMNLVDHSVDGKGGSVIGIDKERVTSKSLDATINLANPTSYALPGVGPNGADYVVLKQSGAALRSLSFTGNRTVQGDATPVKNWHVSLVGIDKARHRVLVKSADGFSESLTASQLAVFRNYPVVVAVISHDNPDDLNASAEQYAGYSVAVNGVRREGL